MIVLPETKAEVLERLQPLLQHSIVLPQARFTANEWKEDSEGCMLRIHSNLPDSHDKIIIRSSCLYEDRRTQSLAGCFKSIGDMSLHNESAVVNAIEEVFDSFGDEAHKDNQVFVQPFLDNVLMSGVVFTRDIDTMAPYYIINYDDTSGSTNLVTSGRSANIKRVIIFKGHKTRFERFKSLIPSIKEIESVLDNDCLDIEFAVDKRGSVYTLQVRPIINNEEMLPRRDDTGRYLIKIYKKFVKLRKEHPYLHGDDTVFGVMPDWNPAEIIGTKPRPLSLSLYKYLITDRTWAYQRDNYGYMNLRSFPLMITFVGLPYIDVRVSFNSFIPKGLSNSLASKLANYYMDRLKKNRGLHDKVEFDIVFSCYSLDIGDKLDVLKDAGFSNDEIGSISNSLRSLTNNIISIENSVFERDIEKIEKLKDHQEYILKSDHTIIEKIYWLDEDCRRYGTLPFAGLARAGFIAIQMLRSLVTKDIIDEDELNTFMASLNTVTKQMTRDHLSMSKQVFLNKYGHLRPGTYDIRSARYDEAYNIYFGPKGQAVHDDTAFEFKSDVFSNLNRILERENLNINADKLIRFFRKAIEAREYAKFVFTKSVSEILNLIKDLSKQYNLSDEDASFIDIRTLLQLYATVDHRDLSEILKEDINKNRGYYEVTKLIKLPPLIIKEEEIFEFELDEDIPNYVTLDRCCGEVVEGNGLYTKELKDKIVFISNADPGFDWIFAKKIAGLVTMYGGSNSHMAIRAAELKIPSVIGSGERNYSLWSKASLLEIDCECKQVRILR